MIARTPPIKTAEMTSTRSNTPSRTPARPQFADFSRARQVWETAGCAILAGAVTGWALGTSLLLYLGTAGLASLAGLPAATQHRTLRGALTRTTVGGFLWAAAVLTVFLLTGREAVTHVPDPIGWYLVLATLPATAAGWAVWSWTNRVSASATLVLRPSRTGASHLPGVPLPARVGAAPLG